MAKLNFPDPSVTQTYVEAGVMWTWNATLGVWSAESGVKGEYLSKTDDDVAQGNIQFNQNITVDGAVGIGTDPHVDAELDILSTSGRFFIRSDQGSVCLDSINASNSDFTDLRIRGNDVIFQSGANERGRITDAGHFLLNDATRIQFGTSDSASIIGKQGSTSGYISLAPNSEIVRITSTGKVGINDTDPKQTLTVRGPSNDTVNADNAFIRFQGDGGNGLLMGNKSSTNYSFYLQSGFLGDLSVKYPISLNPLGGNVGINTIEPRLPFEIKKGQNATEYYPTEFFGFAGTVLNCIDNAGDHGLFVANRWAGADSIVFEAGSLYSNFSAYNSYFRIRGDGYIGVGRTTPKQRLDVQGNIQLGQNSGYGFLQFGNNTSNWSHSWHVGSNGVGGFEIYSGNVGSTASKKIELGAQETKLFHNLRIAPPTTTGEGGDIVLTLPNQNDPGLTVDVLNNTTYRLFTTVANSTLQIGNLGAGAHTITFYCGDGVSPMYLTQGYSYHGKDLRFGYANTQVFPGIGNLDVGGIMSISPTSGTILALSRQDGDCLALNRTGTNGDLISMRKNGAIKGSIEINDSNIRITGLAGGPIFRNGFNIDSSEGLIEAFKVAVQTIADLESTCTSSRRG